VLAVDPGVVDQHVDPAELADDPSDERPGLFGVGDVGLQRQMAGAGKGGQGVLGRPAVGAELDGEGRAPGRELLDHGTADPAGTARDQHHRAVEVHVSACGSSSAGSGRRSRRCRCR
jgi:hypothetical protein